MTRCSMYIKAEKIKVFDEILKSTNGRYLQNPFEMPGGNRIHVTFDPGDYQKFYDAWDRANREIKEIVKQDVWFVSMIKKIFKC